MSKPKDYGWAPFFGGKRTIRKVPCPKMLLAGRAAKRLNSRNIAGELVILPFYLRSAHHRDEQTLDDIFWYCQIFVEQLRWLIVVLAEGC